MTQTAPAPPTEAPPVRVAVAQDAEALPARDADAAEPVISFKNLHFYYGSFRAVKDISIDVRRAADHRTHRPVRLRQVARCCARSTG